MLLKPLVFFHPANIQFLHTNIQIFRGIFDKNCIFSRDTPLFLGYDYNFIKFQFEIISTLSHRFLYYTYRIQSIFYTKQAILYSNRK